MQAHKSKKKNIKPSKLKLAHKPHEHLFKKKPSNWSTPIWGGGHHWSSDVGDG